MHITLEPDYEANDSKGLFVHMYGKGTGCTALIRIVDEGQMIRNGSIVNIDRRCVVWYESQNPEYMFDVEDEYMTAFNIELVKQELAKMFPNPDIDTLNLREVLSDG